MEKPIPSRDQLKLHARQLRQTLAKSGHTISHAQALENIAHQWGARDWNTLSAKAANSVNRPAWQIGQSVTGHYLGHAFDAVIKSATRQTGGYWRLTLVFDAAIDVVASDHFSNFRKQVACTINAQGISPAGTSNGEPQMRLCLP